MFLSKKGETMKYINKDILKKLGGAALTFAIGAVFTYGADVMKETLLASVKGMATVQTEEDPDEEETEESEDE